MLSARLQDIDISNILVVSGPPANGGADRESLATYCSQRIGASTSSVKIKETVENEIIYIFIYHSIHGHVISNKPWIFNLPNSQANMTR